MYLLAVYQLSLLQSGAWASEVGRRLKGGLPLFWLRNEILNPVVLLREEERRVSCNKLQRVPKRRVAFPLCPLCMVYALSLAL